MQPSKLTNHYQICLSQKSTLKIIFKLLQSKFFHCKNVTLRKREVFSIIYIPLALQCQRFTFGVVTGEIARSLWPISLIFPGASEKVT